MKSFPLVIKPFCVKTLTCGKGTRSLELWPLWVVKEEILRALGQRISTQTSPEKVLCREHKPWLYSTSECYVCEKLHPGSLHFPVFKWGWYSHNYPEKRLLGDQEIPQAKLLRQMLHEYSLYYRALHWAPQTFLCTSSLGCCSNAGSDSICLGPRILHFWGVSQGCWCCWPLDLRVFGDTPELHCPESSC